MSLVRVLLEDSEFILTYKNNNPAPVLAFYDFDAECWRAVDDLRELPKPDSKQRVEYNS